MKLVCGTDFSDRAKIAAELSVSLARRLGDTVVLVHALEPWVAYPLEYQADLTAVEVQRREAATAQLRQLAMHLRELGAEVIEEIREGFGDRVLAELSRASDVRMVVVGSHGRQGVS